MKTKLHDFEVLIPNIEGTEIVQRIKTQITLRWDEESYAWVLTPEAHDLIDTIKARHMGLLLPDEFKTLRKKLKLSQKDMGEIFQVGGKSWTRWESGKQRPSRSISLLIRALRDGEISLNYLLKSAGRTPVEEKAAPVPSGDRQWLKVLKHPEENSMKWSQKRETAEAVLKVARASQKPKWDPSFGSEHGNRVIQFPQAS